MRIAIVGPAHPYKGGIPLHTTELAHRLQADGHDVELISWKRQYPSLLYPGVQRVPIDKPEMPVFANTTAPLNWYDPVGWWRLGRRLRHHDMVILTYFVPQFQGTSGLAMMQAMGRRRPRVVAICHNVLQHDWHPGDKTITRAFLRAVDLVIVHNDKEADLARQFTTKPVRVARMAAHLPAAAHGGKGRAQPVRNHLLFFGLIRKYKGVDVLLQALAQVPGVSLTIAGEPRGSLKTEIPDMIEKLGLADRVDFKPGYLPAEELPTTFGAADALVLPYRAGSDTQNVAMAFAHGLPVIATRAAGMDRQVRDGVDGLLCQPNDVKSLTAAIQQLYQPGVLQQLQAGIPAVSADADWRAYIEALLATES